MTEGSRPPDPDRPGQARPAPATPRRWPVALLSAVHAPVFIWAAIVLPWRTLTVFSVVTALLAALHIGTAILTLLPHPLAPRAWRATSLCSLAYLAYLSFGLLSAAVYVGSLNRGLGSGVAAALAAVWAIVALLTLPFACWGVAATGGLRPRRSAAGVLAALAALACGALVLEHRVAKADVLPVPGGSPDRTSAALRDALSVLETLPAPRTQPPSLLTIAPATCAAPPGPAQPTILITHFADSRGRVSPITRCVQPAAGEDPATALRAALATGLRGTVKIDVVSATQPMRSPGPLLEGLSLRPGLDGICRSEGAGARCLAPWQLIALDAFNANMPLPDIPDFRFGISLPGLRKILGEDPPQASLQDLVRIETLSYVIDAEGALHLMSRLGQPALGADAAALTAAGRAAQAYIVSAQRADGMFRYIVQPFTGRASFDGFSIARQAGTTLALCELGEPEAVKTTVRRSLSMLATLERTPDSAPGLPALGALAYPREVAVTIADLNPTALSLIAFLSCRSLAGTEHDARIGRLGRMILATQRDDGGFAPRLDLARRAPVLGPGNLYESGQSIFALVLLEALSAREPSPALPPSQEVRAAVDRAMDYFATQYWDHFAKDFLYLEENWHCLAARAALGNHRHDGYERFCLDYVSFKSRIVLDEESAVHPDFLGGYGFGNVLPPHNTSTAGFGEALAAAMALKAARGEDLSKDRALMTRVLAFLVRQQWDETSCFACARNVTIQGGFSESMASPQIRIDYVQHAWAAIGHGGRMLTSESP